MEVKVLENILASNEAVAQENERLFKEKGVFALNLMASPGAGKTSLILETINRLREDTAFAVIEGDIASNVDAEKIQAQGVPSIQINTGGACHLEASMIKKAIAEIDLDATDVLIIENVGNLVCPVEFKLGETARVMILSIAEGDDKPLKYPSIFRECEAIVLNKVDMLELTDFSFERVEEVIYNLNPAAMIFPVSCRTGSGLDAWTGWLKKRFASEVANNGS